MAWLDQFSKGIRAAYPAMRMGVAQGLNRTTILKSLKDAGMGVRNTDGLRVLRTLQATMKDPSLYLDNDITKPPIPELIPPSLTDQTKRYSWVIEGDVFDSTSELWYKKHVTIETNYLQTQADIIEMGNELMRDQSEDYGTEVGSVRIASISDSFSSVIRL